MVRSARAFAVASLAAMLFALSSQGAAAGNNVIFFHPDGTGVGHWAALRAHKVGPDGELNWDKLPEIGVYTGHVKDNVVASSHGGATTHAYGVKVMRDSFGLDGTDPIVAASGTPLSLAEETLAAGKSVGLVQSGQIAEPGTAAFVASVESRSDSEEIARQVIESGVQVIMAGGEKYLLPEGVTGRHGPGARTDGVNLIDRARELGYEIVHTRAELAALDLSRVDKLIGVFASRHTFQTRKSRFGRFGKVIDPAMAWLFGTDAAADHQPYVATAPTVGEMAKASLEILSRNKAGFLLVVEEEGTDNLSNVLDIHSLLVALSRADDAIGDLRRFVDGRRDTLLLMAADSNAAGIQVTQGDDFVSARGAGGGEPLPFSIGWVGDDDLSSGVLVRAAGFNAELIAPLMDNTDVYKLIRHTLFGASAANGISLSHIAPLGDVGRDRPVR